MSSPTREHVSPELILVAPPEEAELARQRLAPPPPPPSAPPKETQLHAAAAPEAEIAAEAAGTSEVPDWDEFLTGVRSSAASAAEERSRARVPHIRRRSRKPIIFAIVILAVAASIALAWARARSEQNTATPLPASTPTVSQPTPTAAKSVPRSKTSKGAPQSKPTAKPGPFVPSRVWSWARVPGSARYLVRFFRGSRRVLAVRTVRPQLILPKSFAFRPGRYRWVVVSISAKGKKRAPVVDSSFVVARR